MEKITQKRSFVNFLWQLSFCSFILINSTVLFFANALDTSSIRKSSPIYQNPFDLASGGASLTRATQEGMFFSNPSLPAFGEGVFRWIFFRSTISVGQGTINLGKDILQTASNTSNSQIQNLSQNLIKNPLNIGIDNAAGIITSNFGLAGFASGKLDVEGREFGSIGLPELRVRSNSFAGVASTFSTQFGDILAIGIGPKYIYNAEINTDLGINAITNPSQIKDNLTDALKKGNGISTDVGFTLQSRSKNFDLRLAGVIADVGNTSFSGGLPPWLQTYNVGVGFAIHDFNNALHCSIDYRDITDVYGEDLPKKIYMGCKLLLTRYVGFGFGYLQGWPSYGVVLNLFLFRIELGTYTKDAGVQSGLVGRKIYFASLGFEI